ncbi:MAG: hypothetical protein ACMXYC_01040 [Candidatus Woesearchaeota archaeon]
MFTVSYTNVPTTRKAQVTLFIGLGVALLLMIGLAVFFMASTQQQSDPRISDIQEQQVRVSFQTCVEDMIEQASVAIGNYGGYLHDEVRRMPNIIPYYDNTRAEYGNYTVWCTQNNNFGCLNTMVTRTVVEQQFVDALEQEFDECLDFIEEVQQEQGINWNVQGTPIFNVTLSRESVDVYIDMVTTAQRQQVDFQDAYVVRVASPIGELYELATYISYKHLTTGSFDKDAFMYEYPYRIHIMRPYPNTLYEIEFIHPTRGLYSNFRFAIEDKNTIRDIPNRFVAPLQDGCKTQDGIIFARTTDIACNAVGGEVVSHQEPWTLHPFRTRTQEPESCIGIDGDVIPHGQSWCEFLTISGNGLDYVGNRHFVRTCIDGAFYIEPCRDYREELCAQQVNPQHTSMTQAQCRMNRWHDCALQTNRNSCENQAERDCVWYDNLRGGTDHSSQAKQNPELCAPAVPPGFQHWIPTLATQNICSMGNEIQECDGFHCPAGWIERSKMYCANLGDCGNYRNINNVITRQGFYTLDPGYNPRPGAQSALYNFDTSIYVQEFQGHVSYDIDRPTSQQFTHFNTRANSGAISAGMAAFKAKASKWDECDVCVCRCLLGICIPVRGCQFRQMWFSANVCSVWQAPQEPQEGRYIQETCQTCGSSLLPCSEYWCKSISKDCVYTEHFLTGEPQCTLGSGQSDADITLFVNNTQISWGTAETVVNPSGITEYFYDVPTAIPSFSPLNISIILSRQGVLEQTAYCSIERSINLFSSEFIYRGQGARHDITLYPSPLVYQFFEGFDPIDIYGDIFSGRSQVAQQMCDLSIQTGEPWDDVCDLAQGIAPLNLSGNNHIMHLLRQMRSYAGRLNNGIVISCFDNRGLPITKTHIRIELQGEQELSLLNQSFDGTTHTVILNKPSQCISDSEIFACDGLVSAGKMEPTTCTLQNTSVVSAINCSAPLADSRQYAFNFNRTQNTFLNITVPMYYNETTQVIILNRSAGYEVTELDLNWSHVYIQNVLDASFGCKDVVNQFGDVISTWRYDTDRFVTNFSLAQSKNISFSCENTPSEQKTFSVA